MSENIQRISPPDLKEAEALLADLFQEVRDWEGTLAGGTELAMGAAAVDSLFQTKVDFGNPRDNFILLTPALFEEAGVELNAIRQQQMQDQFDFYYMTVRVNMRPKPGVQFKVLCCELNFGPKGENEPIVQTIFPKSKWRTVMNWGGGMSLGLDGNLEWRVGVDAAQAAEIANLPGELKANVANKDEFKASIVIPDYNYEVGRFDIAAAGEGGSECYWYIQEPDLQKMLSVQFGVVFKVPKDTQEVTLRGVAWAEPRMNWLVANIRDVFGDLGDRLQALLRQKDVAADKFARGAAEQWTLTLPKGS
jgi:hypothetical protein